MIKQRLDNVHAEIARHCEAAGRDPSSVQLLPISKRHPVAMIREVVDLGVTVIGENRVQELVQKAEEMCDQAKDLGIRWHMVGSVQTNKARQLLRVPNIEPVTPSSYTPPRELLLYQQQQAAELANIQQQMQQMQVQEAALRQMQERQLRYH